MEPLMQLGHFFDEKINFKLKDCTKEGCNLKVLPKRKLENYTRIVMLYHAADLKSFLFLQYTSLPEDELFCRTW